VCFDETGHAEAVEVAYDPSLVSYEKLLEVFFASHDPTTPDRQGPNVRTQYRSAVFAYDAEQAAAAKAFIEDANASGRFKRPIVTAVVSPAPTFWRAESYHQQYYAQRGRKACATTIRQ
jgi:peptide-methionine (S)-S-oxide reductase